MANIDTLFNDFASALSPTFTGSATVASGYADCDDGAANPITSTDAFTFTGSTLIVKVYDGSAYYGDGAVICAENGGNHHGIGRHWTPEWKERQFNSTYASIGTISGFGGADNWIKMVFGASNCVISTGTDGTSWTERLTSTVITGTNWDSKKLRLNLAWIDQVGIATAASPLPVFQHFYNRQRSA